MFARGRRANFFGVTGADNVAEGRGRLSEWWRIATKIALAGGAEMTEKDGVSWRDNGGGSTAVTERRMAQRGQAAGLAVLAFGLA